MWSVLYSPIVLFESIGAVMCTVPSLQHPPSETELHRRFSGKIENVSPSARVICFFGMIL